MKVYVVMERFRIDYRTYDGYPESHYLMEVCSNVDKAKEKALELAGQAVIDLRELCDPGEIDEPKVEVFEKEKALDHIYEITVTATNQHEIIGYYIVEKEML